MKQASLSQFHVLQIRKSTDGQGVVMWWFDNGWRIVRAPKRPYTYRVETSDHHKSYKTTGGLIYNLAVARHIVARQIAQ